MRDDRLVGMWTTEPYDYGVMESSWLALRPDGTGWSAWANAGGATVSHLAWDCPADGEVELRYEWWASGVWPPGNPPWLIDVDEEGPDETVIRTRYSVNVETPPLADSPLTVVHLDPDVEYSSRYALVTREAGAWINVSAHRRPPSRQLSDCPCSALAGRPRVTSSENRGTGLADSR
ncbi:hypothetical protein [Micromonospora sp. NPDC051006]|uniref:hypothetical protein n=1 Tax=Micromonospora sp. NPDC051006 TaxID=3364283 RepID=UPI00379ADB4E